MGKSTIVLTRRLGETLIIGGGSADAVEVTPVVMKAEQVKLEVRAPRTVPLDQLEVHEREVANGS